MSSEIIEVEAVEDGEARQRSRSPFKNNKSFREIVERLINDNADNMTLWLAQVANGKPSYIIDPNPETGTPGGIIEGAAPDPGKALEIMAKLAEFASPKLTRATIAGDPDNPALVQPVVHLSIGGNGNGGT